ncbi:MAG: sensor histidine kinase [Candidatus Methylomirabilales bacterium]
METGAKILVVDDNEQDLSLIRAILRRHGYDPLLARSGEEAIRQVLQDPPDLILLDVMMPGMDGFEVCRRLKDEQGTRLTPIVIMTALDQPEDEIRGIEAGADDFLTKPVNQPELMARVRRALKFNQDLLAAQATLVRKTRMAAMGEIAAAVAHEGRNLLGALNNCVRLLRTNPHITGDDAEVLDIIQGESQRLNQIASDFVAFGRPEPPHFQDVDLHEFIDETSTHLQLDDRSSSSIAFVRQFDPSLPKVRADRDLLRRAIWNLFLNALQAMEEKGELRVETRSTGSQVEIAVRDTGPGIPATALPNIFDPFYSTKSGRAGLGLPIVRRIVEQHGGQITVDSQQGVGTCFVVALPLQPKGQ